MLTATWHGLRTHPPPKLLLGLRLRFLLLTYGHPPPTPPTKLLLGLRLRSLLLTYGHPFQTVMELTVYIVEELRLKPKRAKLLGTYSIEKDESGTSLRVKQCGTPKTARFADRDGTTRHGRHSSSGRPVDPSSGALGRQLNVITDVPGPRAFCPRRPTHFQRAR